MESDHWNHLKEIFQNALERDPGERAAYLDEACKGDDALRKEVEILLRTDSKAESFMETPLSPPALADENGVSLVDMQIGNYLLERVIATGGMGTVYEAMQEQPKRVVAVKVMRAGIATKSALRRFEYEAEILAKLRHPNIAQVIEAGTHRAETPLAGDASGGLPYFVMELIPDARSITDYVKKKKRSTSERIKLFLQVCDAVQHGHQKGVIHRDLKPNNILVDATGQVKVIDFGVARATDSDVALTTVHTEVGQLIGTLQYMSPEQCKADPGDLDTRSDVYALGVVLYEIVCEALPYDVRNTAVLEAARLIREKPPRRPSTINRTLKGDLETIVLKALEKDRNDRYQAVADLSDDLRRFLQGDVIQAKPVGPATRFWKGVKRNPVVSGSLGAALLAFVVCFLYVVLWSLPLVRAERDRAQTSAELALTTNAFLRSMLASPDPYHFGKDVKVMDVLDIAAARIEKAYADNPLIEATLRSTIGTTYYHLGMYDKGETQLKLCIKTLENNLGNDHELPIKAKGGLGLLLMEQGKIAESKSLLEETLERARRVLGEEHPTTMLIMHDMGCLLADLGRFKESEEIFLKIIQLSSRILGEEAKQTLSSRNNLAMVLREQGRYGEAEEIHREVLELRRNSLGDDHIETLTAMMSLANVLVVQDEYDEAEALDRNIIKAYRQILGDEHPFTLTVRNNLADVIMKQGHLDEALAMHQDVLELNRSVLGNEHARTLLSMHNLADVLRRQGKFEEAEGIQREVLALRQKVLGDHHPDTLSSMSNLVKILQALDELFEAETMQRELLDARTVALGKDHPSTLSSLYKLAHLLEIQDRFSEAVDLLEARLEEQIEEQGENHPDTLGTMDTLAIVLDRQGQSTDAEALFKKALEARITVLGEDHFDTLRSMHNMTIFNENHGNYLEMERLNRRLLEARRRVHGPEHAEVLKSLNNLAQSLMLQEKYQEAELVFVEGLELGDRAWPEHGITAVMHVRYGNLLLMNKRFEKAEQNLKQGYDGLLDLFGEGHWRTRDAANRLADLYDTLGNSEEAAKWTKLGSRDIERP